MKNVNDLEERLINFAVDIIQICRWFPDNDFGKHISNQLLRSGTSPAAHYAEARGAESQKDFIHKMRIGLKELNETQVWLKIAAKSDIITPIKIKSLLHESIQLGRIFNASIKTAKNRLKGAQQN